MLPPEMKPSSIKFQFVIRSWLLFASAGAMAADCLPPLQPWTGASEALIARPDDPWITPSEKTGLTETPSYGETVAYLKRLEKASPLISLQEFGHTAQGRALCVVVAATGRAFSPAEG